MLIAVLVSYWKGVYDVYPELCYLDLRLAPNYKACLLSTHGVTLSLRILHSPRTQLFYKYMPRASRARSHHDCERSDTHQGAANNLNRHHLRTFTRTAPANYIDISLNQKWTATTQARTWMQEPTPPPMHKT
jgi:hypothetical protein